MAFVRLKAVNKVYPNGFHAVHDQSLEIEEGEFMVFVGPSGCAKSTTLNMIAGLEEITSGEIWIGGRMVNELPPKDRDIAMVFQNYALYPHKNVYENMAFSLRMRKHPKAEIDRRVREAAEILDLTDLLKQKPKALSGGQRQRVAVGRAIVRKPKVFLFDEPLSNLDAKLRVQMRVEIIKLHKQLQSTIIYVTHDQVEAMTMGDRITVMKEGAIQQVDTPINLYNSPINKFVATFIGSPAMNIFPARLEERNGGRYVVMEKNTALKLPRQKAAKLPRTAASDVLLGVRPEDMRVATETDNAVIAAHVEIVEQMGSDLFAYFNLGENQYTARLSPNAPASPGATVRFAVEMDNIHLFDPQTEDNLTLKP